MDLNPEEKVNTGEAYLMEEIGPKLEVLRKESYITVKDINAHHEPESSSAYHDSAPEDGYDKVAESIAKHK